MVCTAYDGRQLGGAAFCFVDVDQVEENLAGKAEGGSKNTNVTRRESLDLPLA